MNGLIAFFDILGYQSFLENNPTSESVEKVLALITDLPKQTKSEVLDRWMSIHEGLSSIPSKPVATAFSTLIFSDTIVLSIEYPPNPSEVWIQTALNYLITISGVLCHVMFKEGLPLRGAIAEVDFIQRQNCFAGKAIIEAYKLCHTLDLSSVVVHPSLNEKLPSIFPDWPLDDFLVHYLTPRKKFLTKLPPALSAREFVRVELKRVRRA